MHGKKYNEEVQDWSVGVLEWHFTPDRHSTANASPRLVERHAAPDVSRHVQILAVVDGRLALFKTAFRNNL